MSQVIDQQPDLREPVSARPLKVMHVMGGMIRSGVDSVALTLAAGMRDQGVETVFTPWGEGRLGREARAAGFVVEPLAKKRHLDLVSIPRLAGLMRKHRVDLVNSHELNGAFYACPAARLAGVAHVNSYHLDLRESGRQVFRWNGMLQFMHRYYLFLLRRCDRIITIAPSLRDEVVAGGVPRGKVVFIPTAIDLGPYDPACPDRRRIRTELGVLPGEVVIGTACRLQKIKNLPMLLRAAGQLLDSGEKVRLVVAGEGNERQALERLAADLGIAVQVRFTGFRNDLPRLMSAFDIFALTSKGEGIPISILEAMALGKPVVATDVGGVNVCLDHGRTGFMVPSEDVPGLAEALRELARDPEKTRRMGGAARQRVEREFASPVMVRRTLNLYRNVTAERARKERH